MSTNNSAIEAGPFPAPFGGVPDEYDFVPSLLLVLGSAATFVAILSAPKGKRTAVKWTSACVSLEKMVVLGMRLAQSKLVDCRESWGLNEYQQATLSAGFVVLLHEIQYLMLSTAVSATRNGLTYKEWLQAAERNPAIKDVRKEEKQQYRSRSKKMVLVTVVVQLIQICFAILSMIPSVSSGAYWLLWCRFLGNCLCLGLGVGLLSSVQQLKHIEGINRTALQRIKLTLIVIIVVPIYRCGASFQTVDALTVFKDPSSIVAKVAFYLFQLVPELLAVSITTITDYRRLSDTGRWGDEPRQRVESGLPPHPLSNASMKLLVQPQLWPRYLSLRVQKARSSYHRSPVQDTSVQRPDFFWDANIREKGDGLWVDRRSPVSDSQSSVTLASTQHTDIKEKAFGQQSDWSGTSLSFQTSRLHTLSNPEPARIGSTFQWRDVSVERSTPLVANVKTWTPRLPGFMRNGDSV